MRLTGCLITICGSILVLVPIVVLALAAAGPEHQREWPALRPGPPPKVFAFVSNLGGAELRRLKRVGLRIDVVAPNWYALDVATGLLRGPGGTPALLGTAHRAGVAVWPVVNARTGGSRAWEPREARARIASSLMAAADRPGATGVTLDMEELRPDQRSAFTALVRDAAARLHAAGRQLAVYVPRPGKGSAAAYDWSALAASADLLLCSGYNEHWSSGPPGPTTTARGFRGMLDQALRLAGPAKAVPVLGAFGYRWSPRHGGELISSAHAQELRSRTGGTAIRSDGSERFRIGPDTVVYETAGGLRARAAAAREAGAHWLGLFSLGREPATFWPGLETSRGGRRASRR